MAKAYFIGGVPRVGKTTLTHRFLEKRPVLAASTDAIRYTIRKVINPEVEPKLFSLLGLVQSNDTLGLLHSDPKQVIQMQNDESEIVWDSVLNFVKSNLEDGFDVLIEGVAILPNKLANVDFDYSAVFLGNRSLTHHKMILNSVEENPHDWMNTLQKETINDFANFFTEYSEYFRKECEMHNQTYVEVLDSDFETSLDNALTELLK